MRYTLQCATRVHSVAKEMHHHGKLSFFWEIYFAVYFSSTMIFSLVPWVGLVCEECPLGLSAFLSTRRPKDLRNIRYVILNKSDGELHEIVIKLMGVGYM